MDDDVSEKLKEAQKKINDMKEDIKKKRSEANDTTRKAPFLFPLMF